MNQPMEGPLLHAFQISTLKNDLKRDEHCDTVVKGPLVIPLCYMQVSHVVSESWYHFLLSFIYTLGGIR